MKILKMAVLACVVGCGGGAMSQSEERVVIPLEGKALPSNMAMNQVTAQVVKRDGARMLKVEFEPSNYPNAFFTAPEHAWDWSGSAGIAVDLINPESEAFVVCMRVDNEGADGFKNCNTGSTTAVPGERTTLRLFFRTPDRNKLWGMRGLPKSGPIGWGAEIDPSRIVAFQVFLDHPTDKHTLLLDNFRVFGEGGDVPLPFVDRLGQYLHADWPGKLQDEKEFPQRRAEEEKDLKATPELKDRDRFGGWTRGPKLQATGWFRTEKLDEKWWLVTPEGHLFFSLGMDCVGTWEKTFVQGREDWFEWLPNREEEPWKDFFSFQKGAHSMADPIGGEGWAFGFYTANLLRKYGEDWPNLWRENAYARLRSWGFNTVANWSQEDVLQHSPMPYVVSLWISGDFKVIEGATGYWGRMKDVYDPRFVSSVTNAVAHIRDTHARNPLCIGYFVDNELSWETIQKGVLASPSEQPARQALIRSLQDQYKTLEALNAAWATQAADWDSLRAPDSTNDVCRKDLDIFTHAFAKTYFEAIQTAIKTHAPNQLYLGCRFATAPEPVVQACAEVADVVSFNLYRPVISCKDFGGDKDLGKPIIIGEFHFGALDRGMFHTGLVPTKDQSTRAESYIKYVESVANCPSFVGCHWFQYVDEPITGRWFDGENYNIGFVNVVDIPYPELVKSARKVHAEIYSRRYKGQ